MSDTTHSVHTMVIPRVSERNGNEVGSRKVEEGGCRWVLKGNRGSGGLGESPKPPRKDKAESLALRSMLQVAKLQNMGQDAAPSKFRLSLDVTRRGGGNSH